MKRVLKIEQGKPPRQMQFSDQMWEQIRQMNMGGVTWELLPEMPAPKKDGIIDYPKVNTDIKFIPDEIPIPGKPADPVKDKVISITSQKIEKPKDETPKVRAKRPAKKRVQRTPKARVWGLCSANRG